MHNCWLENPHARPTFTDIKHRFRNYDMASYENIMSLPLYENAYSSGMGRTSAPAVVAVTNMTSDGSTSNGTVTFASGESGPAVHFSAQNGGQKAAEAAKEADAAAMAEAVPPAEAVHTSV